MVKAELVAKVAAVRGLKVLEAQQVVDTMFAAMVEALVDGDGIEVRGFASFRVRSYQGRQGRDPRTGRVISVLPKRGVAFKPGAELRARVNTRARTATAR